MYFYADGEIERMKKAAQLIVFGAGDVARLIMGCLKGKPYGLPIEYCLVSSRAGNPERVCGVPVIDYGDAERLARKDAAVLVAVAEKNLDGIREGLRLHGFSNIIPVTFESDLWSLLRGNCYRDYRLSRRKPYLALEEELRKSGAASERDGRSIRVYSARCHSDMPLKEDLSRYYWETPIQAGAALTEKRVCGLCDDTGDNISNKNRQYCELTALYWIWKNDSSDYVGLSHYRRHFELSLEQLRKLACSDIDVVLTIPIMDNPSVEAIYRRDHDGDDWDVMLEAVQAICPEYMPTVVEMGAGMYYYAYNMFIMRREILEDYCAWLFPILSYCEAHCRAKDGDAYQNRYIGFLAEHLMSAYFSHHEGEYKIAHAVKHFAF